MLPGNAVLPTRKLTAWIPMYTSDYLERSGSYRMF